MWISVRRSGCNLVPGEELNNRVTGLYGVFVFRYVAHLNHLSVRKQLIVPDQLRGERLFQLSLGSLVSCKDINGIKKTKSFK